MEENVRILETTLPADFVDGDILLNTDINKIIEVLRNAINANFADILSDKDNIDSVVNSLKGATLSKSSEEILQNSDEKFPSARQVKNYIDSNIATGVPQNLKLISGYDATKTQVLKNISGTLTWVEE